MSARKATLLAAGTLIGSMHDLAMVDRSKQDLWSILGQSRHLFSRIASWADLNLLLRTKAAEHHARVAESTWAADGGGFDQQQQPIFLPSSLAAARAMTDLTVRATPFVWRDDQGLPWAVWIIPGRYGNLPVTLAGGDPKEDYGKRLLLAVAGLGAGRAFDPLARAELQASLDQRIAELRAAALDALRGQLEARVEKLWLLQRAEMLLWWIHAAVLRQRRAVVCLPDVSLARAIAGPNAAQWPKNWRQDLYAALQSLAYLHAAAWTIDTSAWKPPLGWESACISFVKDLRGTAADRCTEDCALWQATHPAPP